ncbi:MAG: amidohydrolase family protein [Verrucomicrobia bacterium]|nr:amidohydrolase family protein [Verrucomicrobiota bacterium]
MPAHADDHLPLVDVHVHLIGNGLRGSGCWLRTPWWQAPFLRIMAREIGLTTPYEDPGFDAAYVAQLRRWLGQSSLGAVVLLASDQTYTVHGEKRTDLTALYVPNEYVFEVCRSDHRFLAGISIHPARADALAELERNVEQGAALLKLLPCTHMVDPNDRRYIRFWERMAELGLPLLAHTGGEFTLPNHRPDLQTPACLQLPLECGVKVIAAHCGSRALPWDHDYFGVFRRMQDRYPNLYGDLAALSQPSHLSTLAQLRKAPTRILHGTDYPVVTSVIWSRLRGWLDQATLRRIRAERNPLERKIELTRALGFPDQVFREAWSVLRGGPPAATRPEASFSPLP